MAGRLTAPALVRKNAASDRHFLGQPSERNRGRAARNGRSMEAEARATLESSVGTSDQQGESLLDVFRRLRVPEDGLTEDEAKVINAARRDPNLYTTPRDPTVDTSA